MFEQSKSGTDWIIYLISFLLFALSRIPFSYYLYSFFGYQVALCNRNICFRPHSSLIIID